jgi:Nanos RNA binding domain
MSYSNKYSNKNSNIKQAKVVPKPFCKVCHDAGKSEAEYTNHFVKSSTLPDAVVVCPTLLSQTCFYCDQTGHTPAYCKLKTKHNKEAAKQAFVEKNNINKLKSNKKVSFAIVNKFNELDDESSSDNEKTFKPTKHQFTKEKETIKVFIPVVKEEFPALTSNTSVKKSISENAKPQLMFSAIVSKSAEQYKTDKDLAEQLKKQFIPPIVVKPQLKASDPDCNWAVEDSDCDDESICEEDDTYDW